MPFKITVKAHEVKEILCVKRKVNLPHGSDRNGTFLWIYTGRHKGYMNYNGLSSST